MKHLKRFNESDEIDYKYYYSCDECNALWRDSIESNMCKHCTSDEIEELTKDEWMDITNSRLEDDEKFDTND